MTLFHIKNFPFIPYLVTYPCFLNSRRVCITDNPLTMTDSFLPVSNILVKRSATLSSLKQIHIHNKSVIFIFFGSEWLLINITIHQSTSFSLNFPFIKIKVMGSEVVWLHSIIWGVKGLAFYNVQEGVCLSIN